MGAYASIARGRLGRLTGRSVLVAAVVSVLVAGLPPVAGAQLMPPVTVVNATPQQVGSVLVQRSAGPVAGAPDGWRLNMNVLLENTGAEDLVLEEARIAYVGGSAPADLVVPVDPGASAPWVIPRSPYNPDDDGPETVVLPPETLPANSRRTAFVPEDRVLPFPVPDQVTVELSFAGFGQPIVVERPLVEYVPPGGATAFPFAASDMEAGEYVVSGQNHRFGAAHRRSATQRFAEDFNVRRWNGNQWVTREGPADENASYFIWGLPVYAMADGTVMRCFRNVPDNVPGERHPDLSLPDDHPDKMPGGGNGFWIQHAPGEYTLYAHFMEGSVPEQLCPDPDDDQGLKYPAGVPGTQVKSGQFLGLVGNSGSSGGPHLHLHTQRGHADFDGVSQQGRPLVYDHVRIVDAAVFDPDEPEPPPWRTVAGAAVTISGREVNGTQVGGFDGYGTVAMVMYDPAPRINLELEKTEQVEDGLAIAGGDLEYTLTVINHGPEVAPNVLIVDTLPAELEYVSDDGPCLHDNGILSCAVGGLAPGQQAAPITIKMAVPHDVVHNNGGGVLTVKNTATALSLFGPVEATWHDNTAEVTTYVYAMADVELVSLEVLEGPPAQLLIGEEATVTLRATITNHGPSWPIDVDLLLQFPPTPGLDVDPLGIWLPADAVELGELRQVDQTFSLTCKQPGTQQVQFEGEVFVDNAGGIDPDPSNNTAAVAVESECVVPVAINIRPGNPHNQVAHNSNGVVPVAILTTEAGEYDLPIAFDATLVDPETVRFGRPDLVWAEAGGSAPHGPAHVRDAHELDDKTKDGDDDLVLHFPVQGSGIQSGDGEACVKGLFEQAGQTYAFFGCDALKTIPPE